MEELILIRKRFCQEGIFGELLFNGMHFLWTLEHAYQQDDQSWQPKIPPGTYICLKGNHVLGSGPIVAFEVLNVPDHTGCLLHPGNTEADSEGCILVGLETEETMVLHSRDAFDSLMGLMKDQNKFKLTIS